MKRRTTMMILRAQSPVVMMTDPRNVDVLVPAKMIVLKGLLMQKLDVLLKVTRNMEIHFHGKFQIMMVRLVVALRSKGLLFYLLLY